MAESDDASSRSHPRGRTVVVKHGIIRVDDSAWLRHASEKAAVTEIVNFGGRGTICTSNLLVLSVVVVG